MKKAILVSNRRALDKDGKRVIWLTAYECPRSYVDKQNQEKFFYPKKEDAIFNICIQQETKPTDYEKLVKLREGALLGLHFSVNDITNKTYVSGVDVIAPSTFTADQIYGK